MTTKEMIEVMQEAEAGKPIEFRSIGTGDPWEPCDIPAWDWCETEYRVKSTTMKTKDEMIKVMSSNGPWQHRRWVTLSDATKCWEDDPDPSWNWLTYEYRVKPESKKVPLGPEDFPAGTLLKFYGECAESWRAVIRVSDVGVCAGDAQLHTYRELTEKDEVLNIQIWYRSLDGGKTWLPCYKIE